MNEQMNFFDSIGLHISPSDGTEPLGVMSDSTKKHPPGKVNWTKDMKGSKDYLDWKRDMQAAMWSLYWFGEKQKMRTDLPPEEIKEAFETLKEHAAVWIRMATQMTAGQRGKHGDLDIWGGNAERTGMNIIILVCHLALHNVFGAMPEYIDDDIRERESP